MLSSSSSTPRPYSPLMEAGDVVYTGRLDKGKGRAVDFEPVEQGQGDAEGHEYPPVNDDEEEERRIQQTLALYASKDMALRKAKRESKMLASASGSGEAKRGSWFGFLSVGGSKDRERQELPFHTHSPDHSRSSSRAGPDQGTYPYPTPYDPPVNPFQPLIASREPTQTQQGRARADSNATITGNSPFGDEHAAASAPDSQPQPSQEADYGYRGPDWRGGQPQLGQQPAPRRTGPEKWWHALCAWGDDLDEGGRDGQAGRTNPFE